VDWIEGTAIAVVIVINAPLGFFTELKAVRSMEALYRIGQATARVRREGGVGEIPAAELVPGAYGSPMSSFHRSGRLATNCRISSMQVSSSSTATSTPRERSSSSSPRKVRFSPTTTFGIP